MPTNISDLARNPLKELFISGNIRKRLVKDKIIRYNTYIITFFKVKSYVMPGQTRDY
ncbi:hypothetical protein acsn021_30140 [Anaerocolumna cellulosilytica]|uniref:Uncharacterized protein n=1 Tax=Anaerocolumna cellulosilytica TaxID=433286 RepID=A0A6S6R8C0_9FIRM|nr:hypothetical protein acsn021_30140 [Anaerocolumna cellulosilytica]